MTLVTTTVEMSIAGVWTDVTDYALTKDGITIRHGASSESGLADPSECSLSLNNTDGRFTPDNPTGPYYGNIGRNTPLRVTVNMGDTRLIIPTFSDSASAPDSAGLSVTGDIDIRLDLRLPTWTPFISVRNLLQKFGAAGQRSYRVLLTIAGHLQIEWSADGTAYTTVSSTAPVPILNGRQAVRVTLDVDNGAAGKTITFYTAPTNEGPWAQLGDPVTLAGTTSIFDSTASVQVSGSSTASTEVYAVEIRDGIDGTVRADPDFTAQTHGATSFVDAAGNTWTMNGDASLSNSYTRFVGEVSEFPSEWDPSEALVVTRVVASGPLRRLGKGISTSSVLRDALIARSESSGLIAAYWPLEDRIGATTFSSAIGGTPMAALRSALPTPQGYDPAEDLLASAPLAAFDTSPLIGSVPDYTSTGTATYGFLVHVPDEGTTNSPFLLQVENTGTADRWILQRIADTVGGSEGLLRLRGETSDPATFGINVALFTLPAGSTHYIYLELTNNGADVDWFVTALGLSQASGTFTGGNIGRATRVVVGGDPATPGGDFDAGAGWAFGHVVIGKTDTALDGSSVVESPLLGYTTNPAYTNAAGESVTDRMTRLAGIAGVDLTNIDGSIADVHTLGSDAPGGILDRMRRAEAADVGGILHDEIDALGLRYITRTALYSDTQQARALELDYSAGNVSPPLRPTDDDFALINDSTVTVENGGTARVVVESGPLNVEPYPDGVGRYEDSRTLALAYTEDPTHYASWIVNTGTVEGQRFTAVTIDLRKNPDIAAAVAELRPGNWLRLVNLPAWLPPRDPELIVRGWSETVHPAVHTVTLNCAPADPYRVFELDDGTYGRLDSETTTLAEALDTTETGVDYTGDTWITTADRPGDFPFDIVVGGEVMTVTSAVAGTFTVTRSVNGVVKTHAIGASIRVLNPARLAL